MKKYIAKPGTWFDEGTEAKLVTSIWDYNDGSQGAVFSGIKNGKPDEEQCCLDEFDIVKDTSVIPKGPYCYKDIRSKPCPYWKMVGIKCGYCGYMDMSDEDFEDYNSLLWDQVKECEINEDREEIE